MGLFNKDEGFYRTKEPSEDKPLNNFNSEVVKTKTYRVVMRSGKEYNFDGVNECIDTDDNMLYIYQDEDCDHVVAAFNLDELEMWNVVNGYAEGYGEE